MVFSWGFREEIPSSPSSRRGLAGGGPGHPSPRWDATYRPGDAGGCPSGGRTPRAVAVWHPGIGRTGERDGAPPSLRRREVKGRGFGGELTFCKIVVR